MGGEDSLALVIIRIVLSLGLILGIIGVLFFSTNLSDWFKKL
jgi:uncharacterized protein YneF (UPF0154 family)